MRSEKTSKASDPEAVDVFLKRHKHPLIGLAKALRRTKSKKKVLVAALKAQLRHIHDE